MQLLARNLSATLLLFSGYVLGGTTTILGLLFVGTWIGAGTHAVERETGLLDVSPSVLLYLPAEFLGLVLAGAAGLLPVVSFVWRTLDRRWMAGGQSSSSPALVLLGVATGLIALGAATEALVIRAHST